ncbi:hypothetical protein WJX74_003927 [Apatococcus lobatus]|uniref:Uncharacterized protein n=1 Tax=Apatococcus lobatus TaxID=904363 RepID=A0AAW1RSE7_9CHLO
MKFASVASGLLLLSVIQFVAGDRAEVNVVVLAGQRNAASRKAGFGLIKQLVVVDESCDLDCPAGSSNDGGCSAKRGNLTPPLADQCSSFAKYNKPHNQLSASKHPGLLVTHCGVSSPSSAGQVSVVKTEAPTMAAPAGAFSPASTAGPAAGPSSGRIFDGLDEASQNALEGIQANGAGQASSPTSANPPGLDAASVDSLNRLRDGTSDAPAPSVTAQEGPSVTPDAPPAPGSSSSSITNSGPSTPSSGSSSHGKTDAIIVLAVFLGVALLAVLGLWICCARRR